MKLWKKISLICGGILVLAVAVCSAAQLKQTRDTLYAQAEDRIHQKYVNLSQRFEDMVAYYQGDSGTPAARKAMLHYCFTRLADSNCILIVEGEKVWSWLDMDPVELCPVKTPDGAYHVPARVKGDGFLLEGGELRLALAGSPECLIYVREDTAPLEEMLGQMGRRFLAVGTGCVLAGLVLIALLVGTSMKPLRKLQSAASEIAAGNYDRRAEISTRDEVGALSESFNHMADSVETHVKELTEAAERQRLFTGAVTHEFKTPLTGILLNTDSLLNTYMTEEEQQEALGAIQSQGQWLERLVQKLLKLLTLKQEITLEPVSARELLESVRESTAEVLKQRGVKLDIQCGSETYQGDGDLLRSALVNLVDNASKASKPGQTVWITASDHRLEVADQGAGIPTEALKHITEPFYMADRSRSKHQGGVGLGLALVKEIVSAHGGSLEVESTPGIGTIVRIKFK